jgi:hypothetical protein
MWRPFPIMLQHAHLLVSGLKSNSCCRCASGRHTACTCSFCCRGAMVLGDRPLVAWCCPNDNMPTRCSWKKAHCSQSFPPGLVNDVVWTLERTLMRLSYPLFSLLLTMTPSKQTLQCSGTLNFRCNGCVHFIDIWHGSVPSVRALAYWDIGTRSPDTACAFFPGHSPHGWFLEPKSKEEHHGQDRTASLEHLNKRDCMRVHSHDKHDVQLLAGRVFAAVQNPIYATHKSLVMSSMTIQA